MLRPGRGLLRAIFCFDLCHLYLSVCWGLFSVEELFEAGVLCALCGVTMTVLRALCGLTIKHRFVWWLHNAGAHQEIGMGDGYSLAQSGTTSAPIDSIGVEDQSSVCM